MRTTTLFLVLACSVACEDRAQWPSAIASDSDGLVVTWAAPRDNKIEVHAARFRHRNFSPSVEVATVAVSSVSKLIYRTKRLASRPEIAANESGAVVFLHTFSKELFGIPLDKKLNPRSGGGARSIASRVRSVCAAPGAQSSGFVVAWIEETRDKLALTVAMLDQDGAVVDRRAIAVGDGQCALGVAGGRVGVVYREASEGHLAYAAFEVDGRLAASTEPVLLLESREEPFRLIAAESGWHMLISAAAKSAEVIHLSEKGEPRGGFTLKDVDPSSVDIATNKLGVVASWIDGERVKIRATDGRGRARVEHEHNIERRSRGTRAVASDSWCATSWTDFFGRTVWVLRAPRC